jgi:hypothetical protein
MKTSDLFEKEINFISNETLQEIIRDTLNAAPECIATIPASSSGKYHATADLEIGDRDGEIIYAGGLVNHVRTVTAIAHCLMDSNAFRDICFGANSEIDYETLINYQDCAIAACILHDCMKPDDSPKHNTKFDHPLCGAKLFKEIATKYITNDNLKYMELVVPIIYKCIASHMNKWNTAKYAPGIVLPLPSNGIEVYVSV